MCDICMHSPCLSGCPNAPDPTPVTFCRSCGEPIVPGDEYAVIDGEAWCEGCLDDLPLCVLIPKLPVSRRSIWRLSPRLVTLRSRRPNPYRLRRKRRRTSCTS